jgi:hypothetical protein
MPIYTPLSAVKIFISYHRNDSAASTGRLYNILKEKFGKKNVFKDIVSMEGGDHIKEKIKNKIAYSDVMLVVIGKGWIEKHSSKSVNPVNEKEDWVEFEVQTAFSKKLVVLPVLVDNAPMPDSTLLPIELKEISEINAAELSYKHYEYDVKKLIQDIRLKTNEKRKAGLRTFKVLASIPIICICIFGLVSITKRLNTIEVGKKFGGGIVFVVDSSKRHGLIAATVDVGTSMSWRNSLDACQAYRGGGFSDWYLPTKDEMSEMYSSKEVIGNFSSNCNPSNFANCSYWTSTEMADTSIAWNFYFTRGIFWDNFVKKGLARARPVRKF